MERSEYEVKRVGVIKDKTCNDIVTPSATFSLASLRSSPLKRDSAFGMYITNL